MNTSALSRHPLAMPCAFLHRLPASFRRISYTLLTLLLLSPSTVADTTRPFQVGVLYWSMKIPGQVAMRAGLEKEAERLNTRLQDEGEQSVQLLPHVAGEGEEGVERQIAQMNQLIADGVDIIIVQPTDNAALSQPLRDANAAGIPVVAYDQYIHGGKLTSFLTSDNYEAGYLDGEYIAHAFPDSQTIKMVLVEYPQVSSTVERVDGFLDGLRDQNQPYEIVGTFTAVEPVAGKIAGTEILQRYPEKGDIDVVFTVNDGGGLAVVDALAEAGRTEIVVASIDGDPASVRNIERKRLTRIDAAQFCGALGAEALRTAHQVLQGKPVSSHILMPVFPITSETGNRYSGWTGVIPESFQKPWPSLRPFWEGKPRAVDRSE